MLHQHRSNAGAPDGPDADAIDQNNGAQVGSETPYDISDTPHEFHVEELGGRFDLRSISRDVLSDDIDQVEFQIDAKVRAIRASFGHYFIHGNQSNPGQFDGLSQFATAGSSFGQVIEVDGRLPYAQIFETLDLAIVSIQSNDRALSNLLIVAHSQFVRGLIRRAREVNGRALLETKYSRDLRCIAPHYMGIPICINDHITLGNNDETDYFVFDRNSVVGLVHRNFPDITMAKVQSETASAESYIISWYVGLASFTDLGLVRVRSQETTPPV